MPNTAKWAIVPAAVAGLWFLAGGGARLRADEPPAPVPPSTAAPQYKPAPPGAPPLPTSPPSGGSPTAVPPPHVLPASVPPGTAPAVAPAGSPAPPGSSAVPSLAAPAPPVVIRPIGELLPAADPAAVDEYVGAVAERICGGIEKQKLPYVTPAVLAALRDEVGDYLRSRVKMPLAAGDRGPLFEAIETFVRQRFQGPESYLRFRVYFDTLVWQVWTASDRLMLSDEERAERQRQREWMYEYVKNLPADTGRGKLQDAGQALVQLKEYVFGSPLIPFFHEPMSAAEFAAFQGHLAKHGFGTRWMGPARIFHVAGMVRCQAVFDRWPPDLRFARMRGLSSSGSSNNFFYFTFGDSDANRPQWFFDTGDKQNRHSFDLAWRSANQQPVQANAELKEDAPGEQKRGSVWFDRDSFRLLPMRGTKLALLDKNEWYTVDRVPLAELRRLLEEAPIESFELPRLKDSNTPASRQELRQIPSLILQNNEGTIAVARVQSGGPPGTLSLQFCYRPQGPYPPFRPADEEYENDGLDTVYIPAAWIKKTPTFPAIPADADVIDAAADRFVASIERQKLSFVTAEHLAALNGEMRRYLKARVKQPPLAASRPEVLEAIDPYVVMLFDRPPGAIGQEQYLNFRNHFETLRWLIWTVLDRPTLTPDQFIERDRQREWMRALVRSLPESPLAAANPEVSKQSQLDRLERNVFNNPLSPFFYDPMSADEFKRLTERYAQNRSLAIEGAAHAIFSAVIDVRLPGLRDRYPSGFPAGNLSVTDFRIFSHGDYIRHIHSQVGMQPKDKSHDYVDLTTGRLVYGQPKILPGQSAPSAEAIEQFWQANKEGDLWFDPAERRLVAVHGAKMVTLPETRWEALDRLSLAELRRSLSGQTVEGVTFSAFANASSPEAVRAFRKWPTLLVETSRGQISLVRAWQTGDGLSLQIRPRPQGSYYPFHGPDEGFEPSERWPLPPLEAVEHLSDRFAEALDRQQLPFVGPREREALRAELREYLELRLRRPLFGPSRKAIVRELERFVERNFEGADGYLRFRARFDALKWRLWTATERRENLTGDEQQALAQQRQWMFHYLEQVAIARLPNGVPPDPAVLTRERGLLDTEYFENPLNPFFRDPMPVEDFETFRKHVLSDAAPKNARKQLFMAAVYTRSAELKRRWPPGFPARRVHVYGAGDFDFGGASDEWNVEWRWNHKPASEHVLLAVADNKLVEPPAELEEKDLQAWIAQNKQGDLSFDAQTGTLLPLRGARLARLDALEWWAIDRVPLAELHQRLADHPLESVTLPEAFASKSQRPTAWERLQGILAEIRLKSQPALVLETAEGKVVVLRVERYDDGMLLVRGRTWPRPPYPPFHAGDLQVAEAAAGRPAPEGGPGP